MPRGRPTPLTAAATVVPLKRPKDARKALGKREEWQEDAWDYFDLVPELKQSTWFLGNAMSKLRLFVAKVPDGDEDPIAADTEGSGIAPAVVAAAKAELARLRGGLGGQGAILREANMNLEIAAEAFLVGWASRDPVIDPTTGVVVTDAQPETWEIRSTSEVEVKGTGQSTRYLVKDGPDDKGRELDKDRDAIIRIYQQHPRWSSRADCAMRGVLTELEALVVLAQQVISEANSKASAGFFTVPNELDAGPPAPTVEGGEQAPDKFADDLATALIEPIGDPSHPSAGAPTLIRGPKEALGPDVLRHITMDRTTSENLDARIEARVLRLARGLNLPLEKVLGHQSTTYANAEQVDQDQFDDHLQPRCVLLVDALTIGFLRSQLRAETSSVRDHPDVDRVMVWYDPSDLIRQPDKAANAVEDLKANAISLAAYREARGWPEDAAPSEEELLQRAGLGRGILTGDLTLALLKLLGAAGDALEVVPMPKAEAQPVGPDGELLPSPEPDQEGQAAIAATGRDSTRRASTLGRQLMDLDRMLRTQLLAAADKDLARALDRAGARLRTKAGRSRDLVANVANRDLPRTMGRDAVTALSTAPADLLEGAFDELREQFLEWGAGAQDVALDAVSQVVSGFTTAERTALKLRQAGDLDEAWGWLEQHLRGFAQERMFAPDAGFETAGELVDALSVPPGMLRLAIARAGGAVVETTGVGGDAWTSITSDGHALGGIGTGDLLMGVLRDHGAGVDGYRWVYGLAARRTPFEPHVELDGVEFTNFDDPVLANPNSFPDVGFYMPGDHAGCICDFEPIIMLPEEG